LPERFSFLEVEGGEVSFLKRLFGGKNKLQVEAMRGLEGAQTDEQQSTSRSKMEAEVTADRVRRAAHTGVSAPSAMDTPSTSAKEEEVIALVTQACAGMDLQTSRVDVHKLEGGTVPTLRFTLNDRVSTDLEFRRITANGESAEVLAGIVVAELRRQAGP
jgi:hypothetical protein